jgi:hypothetical protein
MFWPGAGTGHDVPGSHVQGRGNALPSGSFTGRDAVLMKHVIKLRRGREGRLFCSSLSLCLRCADCWDSPWTWDGRTSLRSRRKMRRIPQRWRKPTRRLEPVHAGRQLGAPERHCHADHGNGDAPGRDDGAELCKSRHGRLRGLRGNSSHRRNDTTAVLRSPREHNGAIERPRDCRDSAGARERIGNHIGSHCRCGTEPCGNDNHCAERACRGF